MRRTGMGRVIVSALVALAAWSASAADAEIFVSVYGGGSFTSNPKVTNRGGADLGRFDLDVDAAGLFGGRVGYWFDPLPYVGIEVDANHASPDIARQVRSVAGIPVPLDGTLRETTLGFHALVRYPIGISKTFPFGQFQPYAGAGVGLAFSKLSLTGTGTGTLNRGPRAGQSGTLTFSGRDSSDETAVPQALVGLKVFVVENLAAFAEYQYSYANLTFGSSVGDLKTKFSTHNISAGFSYHFDLFK